MTEFAHRLTLDRIRDGERLDIVADDEERRAVASRLNLPSIERLEAHAVLSKVGQKIRAEGRVKASLTQNCVATGAPVSARVDEAFDLHFVPEPKSLDEEEVELGADELDTVFHDGLAIDLGSAIADTMALALNPYPRSPDATVALREAGVISEEEAGPFSALAALKEKLGKQ